MADSTFHRPLDLASPRAALQALGGSMSLVSSSQFAAVDPRWRATPTAGVAQHFKLTFELCWKMLMRQLKRGVPNRSEPERSSYREPFRLGNQRGLISAIEPWLEFRELLNITTHTFSCDKADKVAAGAPALLAAAQALLSAIESRNHV